MNFKWPLMKDNMTLTDRLSLAKFVLTSNRFTNGPKVCEFENAWSEWIGCKHSLFVSSGSTANYLLLASIKEFYGFKDGDKVLVPADTWVTNIGPVIQLGFTPIFCDINLDDFSFCPKDLKYIAKIHPDIKVIFTTHLIGFPANNHLTSQLFPNAIKLDDVCESHGCENGNGKVGSDSIGATFSFYFGHHMSTVEGGMITTKNRRLYDLMRIKRSHGLARESAQFEHYKKLYPQLPDQFLFLTDGYNFRNDELSAVLGLSQLKRLDSYIQKRNENYLMFLDIISKYPTKIKMPKYWDGVSNFCLPILCFSREDAHKLRKLFDENGIEHRPIIGGNLLRQPFLKNYQITSKKDDLVVDFVHYNGIYLGNNHFIGKTELNLLDKILEQL